MKRSELHLRNARNIHFVYGISYVYALLDPGDLAVRYIGVSDEPHGRYYNHIHTGKTKPKNKKEEWVRDLSLKGQKPILAIICQCNLQDKYVKENEVYQMFSKQYTLYQKPTSRKGISLQAYKEQMKLL